ncbi:hypothetical protein EDC02_5143 [Micromonospora sp. Llam0]|uniref:hypothetical protein n=1 Tax=Micromonospora sp. Llam0 TaxID=2485143 RepID=UPI000F462691|nr:hypothetical protein [Micromonospora sp. Llam0]ROO63126.1 hypothetical protein EDC02_5143 [Micromonospora sp. Llam0]
MPTYRLWQQDGQDQLVQATRVVSDGTYVYFEKQVGQQWQDVLTVPTEQVERVQRRVNEPSGWRWILARPLRVNPPHRHG